MTQRLDTHDHRPRESLLDFPVNRRDALKLMAASVALGGMTACIRPPEQELLPYRDAPESQIPGKPVYYASGMPFDGDALGILIETHMGRPTKIEGNPDHPTSLGATHIYAQAAVLEVWDPDRSQTIMSGGVVQSWAAFLDVIAAGRKTREASGGAGLRVIVPLDTSPTLAEQLRVLQHRLPHAGIHVFQPLARDSVYAGSGIAFGAALEPIHHFERADVIVAFDDDFLGSPPAQVRHAREFANRRGSGGTGGIMNRLYAIEPVVSLTGAMADHRLALRASEIESAARVFARALGIDVPTAGEIDASARRWMAAAAEDVRARARTSLLVAGSRQPPAVHALVCAMNARLRNIGSTVHYVTPSVEPRDTLASLHALVTDMADGKVDTLVILGGNPVYDAPADLPFSEHLARVPLSVHLGLYANETAARCAWHIPQAHFLESWGDMRAYDGTVTLQQPAIAPLHGGHTAIELIAALNGIADARTYDLVRAYWRDRSRAADFEARWATALQRGIWPETAAPLRRPTLRANFAAQLPAPPGRADSLELVFEADPTIYDGRFANNAWLQELPKPITKLTWDNAVLLSPAHAARAGLSNGDVVALEANGRVVEGPVWTVPGLPDDSATVHLGYGRTRAGRVGDGLGSNAYGLRTTTDFSFARNVRMTKTGRRYTLATAQTEAAMHDRALVRVATLAQFSANPEFAKPVRAEAETASLYPDLPGSTYAWGMSINLDTCIGCGACTIACQAENNIPVVGKHEVLNGRIMHWIRVDRYYAQEQQEPRVYFQPVPCMHCEKAPCEVVCPVEASIHDHEGLNVQVYNRCVGTRFCSNNCPYKVRRFNWLSYAYDAPAAYAAQRNPDVTVRRRGVMEKCTYCLQRITVARIEAEKAGRRLRDGDVVTACQAVCPTEAIVFGDLNDAASRVRARKRSPLDYALLGELNTRPRTTYLAKLANPNPDLGGD
ncbi:MAG: 4Fe-4S dicluster domain-containing protein [Sulfurifustis sp.]